MSMQIHELLNIFSQVKNPKDKLTLYNQLETSNDEEFVKVLKDMKSDLLYYDRDEEYYNYGILTVDKYIWTYPNEQRKYIMNNDFEFALEDELIIVADGKLTTYGYDCDGKNKLFPKENLSKKMLRSLEDYMKNKARVKKVFIDGFYLAFNEIVYKYFKPRQTEFLRYDDLY